MIRFEHFSFSYGNLREPQLNNFDFTIEPGQLVLLCGASACGKTTAAKCINGLIPHVTPGQATGSVWVKGQRVADTPTYELARHVGSVFQNPKTQFFNLDATSELVFGMENLGISREGMEARVERVSGELELGGLLGRKVFDLSGGEKQLLALASVYAVDPEVYVLDEPTANIDREGMLRLRHILQRLKAMGKTVVISEHRLYFFMDLLDRAIFLEHGSVAQDFTGEAFRALSDSRRIAMGLRCFDPPEPPARRRAGEREDLLQVRQLSVRQGKRLLLEKVSFSADAGDIIAVTGANGSGKTALLRTLCGLLREASGTVSVGGQVCSWKKRRALCAMTMQDVAHQLFADSVWDEFGLLNCGVTEGEISAMLDRLELGAYRDRHPMTLSGGQKQRLALAAASLSGKQIMLFDEPTSGLDYGNMCRVSQLIREISRDRIVFVATHDRELVSLLCTRELVIEGGRGTMYDLTGDLP